MKISAVHLYRYELPLVSPIELRDQTLTSRAGILIQIVSEDGHEGWGDAAPLPGFSKESLVAVKTELAKLRRVLPGRDVPPDAQERQKFLDAYESPLPSARCALDVAVLNLVASIAGKPPCQYLHRDAEASIGIAKLLVGDLNQVTREAERGMVMGFSAFKLKVGRKNVEQDIELVRALSRILRAEDTLRLDANRAWGIEDAAQFGRAVRDIAVNIEYIEEPVDNPVDIPAFWTRTELPVALDETLCEMPEMICMILKGVAAFVLKPTLLGGFRQALRFALLGNQRNITPTISSSYESGVGILALAHLSAALHGLAGAAGLDTYEWFREDVLARRLNMSGGGLNLDINETGAPAMNMGLLKRLDDG